MHDIYLLLNLRRGEIDKSKIKKNFNYLIKSLHVDKTQNSELHKELVNAYHILIDPLQKIIYDKYGFDSLNYFDFERNDMKFLRHLLEQPGISSNTLMLIYKYLEKIIEDDFDYDILSENTIRIVYKTSIIDYAIGKYVYEDQFYEGKYLESYISPVSISLNNNSKIYQDSNNFLAVESNFSLNNSNGLSENNFKLKFQTNLNNLFYARIVWKYHVNFKSEFEEKVNSVYPKYKTEFGHSFTIPLSNCHTTQLKFNSIHALNEIMFNFNWNKINTSSTLSFRENRSFNFAVNYKLNNKKDLNFNLVKMENSKSLGIIYTNKISKKSITQHMTNLGFNSLSFKNIIKYKLSGDFEIQLSSDSSYSISREGGHSLNFMNVLYFTINYKFIKLDIPILLSRNINIISNLLLMFPFATVFIYDWIMEKLIRPKKQIEMILNTQVTSVRNLRDEEFNKRMNLLYSYKNSNGNNFKYFGFIIIEFAWIGSKTDVFQLSKNYYFLKDTSVFKELRNTCYDITMQINLLPGDLKKTIPKNLAELDGIYGVYNDRYGKLSNSSDFYCFILFSKIGINVHYTKIFKNYDKPQVLE